VRWEEGEGGGGIQMGQGGESETRRVGESVTPSACSSSGCSLGGP
jgi:hypothetical protein